MKGKAKVAWKQLCYLMDQGGLGLKDSGLWNEALMYKHLWNIASNKESLWVKWVNEVRLKGQSIWSIRLESNSSCGWKQILSLREKLRFHIVKQIGNGLNTFMWHDIWWACSPLRNHVSKELIRKNELNMNVKVVEMIGSKGKFSINKVWNDIRMTKEE
ncbi:hypothetical protein Tco_1141734, partial [Tanacetum coccineum]